LPFKCNLQRYTEEQCTGGNYDQPVDCMGRGVVCVALHAVHWPALYV
jgi:hypothetical protein